MIYNFVSYRILLQDSINVAEAYFITFKQLILKHFDSFNLCKVSHIVSTTTKTLSVQSRLFSIEFLYVGQCKAFIHSDFKETNFLFQATRFGPQTIDAIILSRKVTPNGLVIVNMGFTV